jgi:Ca2+-binding EF-hand superfamily protein
MVFGAEADKLLSPSKKERDALFRKFDGNGNGRLSYGEVEHAVHKIWPDMKQKRVLMAAFSKADSDGSGYVGKTEFGHLLQYAVFFFRLWLLFSEMDTGGDSRITLDEFRHGLIVLQLDFHPDPEVNEAYVHQEWHELDPEGDGLILFDRFCHFALRWQLVEDFEDQTSQGGGTGKMRERPPLDPRFLGGADGALVGAEGEDDADSWRTDASDTFDHIRGRTNADITALSLAFYERAVAAGTIAPVGGDDADTMRTRASASSETAGSASPASEPIAPASAPGSRSSRSYADTSASSLSGRELELASRPAATSGGASLVEGGRTYWSREIGRQRDAAAASGAASSRMAASTLGPAAAVHEPVPNYGDACSRNGLTLRIGDQAHMTSSKGVPVVVVRPLLGYAQSYISIAALVSICFPSLACKGGGSLLWRSWSIGVGCRLRFVSFSLTVVYDVRGCLHLQEILFVGRVHFARGIWAGVQVVALRKKRAEFGAVEEESMAPRPEGARGVAMTAEEKEKAELNNARLAGKHDGKIEGVRYFRCPDRTGLFVRPSNLKLILR